MTQDTTKLDEKALLPCAHCGSTATHYHRDDGSGWMNPYWVSCDSDGCGAQTCLHETSELAIAAWNRRAPAPSARVTEAHSYGLKLIAEAITHHFGDQPEPSDFDDEGGDTTLADVWAAFAALAHEPAAEWEPAGWKLVPVEPTPEMLGAFWRVKNGFHFADEPPPTSTDDYSAYRAMLDAAPPPPEVQP